MVTAIAYFMGLTFGLSIWWLERKRRLLWSGHCDWQKKHIGQLHDLITKSIDDAEQARDAMRWRKAFATMPEGRYAFAMIGQRGSESVLVGHGIVVYGTGGQDAITDLPSQARFLGPLPEVPR